MSEYYKTYDLGEAAYLLYSGEKLLGSAETSNNKRHAIFFEKSDDVNNKTEEYYSGKAMVVARDYSRCTHRIAKELRNPIKRPE